MEHDDDWQAEAGSETINETDSRFPSGPWRGFWLQKTFPGKNWRDLHLTFGDGTVSGLGKDWVGQFVISGHDELEDGRCSLSKQYLGRHTVGYDGYNEGKGIWGNWEMPGVDKGGFHIWPAAGDDPTELRDREALGRLSRKFESLTWVLEGKYWIDEFIQKYLVEPLRYFSMALSFVDRFIIDGAALLLGLTFQVFGFAIKISTQRGNMQGYARSMLVGVAIILILVLW